MKLNVKSLFCRHCCEFRDQMTAARIMQFFSENYCITLSLGVKFDDEIRRDPSNGSVKSICSSISSSSSSSSSSSI